MARRTSAQAYDDIAEQLPKSRRRVYERLLQDGASTGRELNKGLGTPDAHKRLSELKAQGLVVEAGERPCRVTGKIAVTWRAVPDAVPKPLVVPKKPRQLLDRVRAIAAEHAAEGAPRERLVRQILDLIDRPGRRPPRRATVGQLEMFR